jgi:hypothetical protein
MQSYNARGIIVKEQHAHQGDEAAFNYAGLSRFNNITKNNADPPESRRFKVVLAKAHLPPLLLKAHLLYQ